jgi:large subunit ribosomal protein L13
MTHKHLQQSTFFLKKEDSDSQRQWILLDAQGKTLGRFASEIAKILRGKHKTTFTPHVDTGDGVIILNASKIRVSGNKQAQKTYVYYTGYPSGQREVPYNVMKDKKPDFILRHAIKGMMPKTKLSNAQLKRLRIFAGEAHDMDAQKPLKVEV